MANVIPVILSFAAIALGVYAAWRLLKDDDE